MSEMDEESVVGWIICACGRKELFPETIVLDDKTPAMNCPVCGRAWYKREDEYNG